MQNYKQKSGKDTSWQAVAGWYSKQVGAKGDYFHERVIFPKALVMLDLKKGISMLDLACGQGVLARQLPSDVIYTGVDLSADLVNQAKKLTKNHTKTTFMVADVTSQLNLPLEHFDTAAIILALQNIKYPEKAIFTAKRHLKKGGKLLIVLNHPCFRIPRQSGWGINEQNKLQYRWINRYLSSQEIPINMHPGKGQHGEITWSFHQPLQAYFSMLKNQGFVISDLQEWISEKNSEGRNRRRENMARAEIPMFMAILAVKMK